MSLPSIYDQEQEDIVLERPLLAPLPREELTLRPENVGKARVLVVDDDVSMRALVKTILELEAYDVGQAPDGRVAIEMITSGWDPDLVILDLMMPTLSGHEVLAYLKGDARWSAIPVLVMSAGTRLRTLMLEREKPDDILAKPFDIDTLIAHVELLLRKK